MNTVKPRVKLAAFCMISNKTLEVFQGKIERNFSKIAFQKGGHSNSIFSLFATFPAIKKS